MCNLLAVDDMLAAVPKPLTAVFVALGALWLGRKVVSYVALLLDLFVLRGTNLRKYGPKGTWAVITGASDGLGKEYALQLASKGFNLILVSRTESKLATLAHDIETKNPAIKTKILAMDFSKDDQADYAKLAALVAGLDVGILVNNVGQSHAYPVPFLLTPHKEMRDIVTINCLGTLEVTRLIAPGMAQRKRGLILTMGSFGGLMPSPLLATYSGSKAFLQQWSTSLASELQPQGVDVQLVLSYLVTSAMSKIRRPSAMIPNPRNFVRTTLAKVGLAGGARQAAFTATPYWSHAIMQWWIENTVGTASAVAVRINRKFHEDIRVRALKKMERDAKKST